MLMFLQKKISLGSPWSQESPSSDVVCVTFGRAIGALIHRIMHHEVQPPFVECGWFRTTSSKCFLFVANKMNRFRWRLVSVENQNIVESMKSLQNVPGSDPAYSFYAHACKKRNIHTKN